ncbi:MAG: hypothetical protein PVG78_05300 [Desulfobacterales bacterium]|jgi:hypothetical protein
MCVILRRVDSGESIRDPSIHTRPDLGSKPPVVQQGGVGSDRFPRSQMNLLADRLLAGGCQLLRVEGSVLEYRA